MVLWDSGLQFLNDTAGNDQNSTCGCCWGPKDLDVMTKKSVRKDVWAFREGPRGSDEIRRNPTKSDDGTSL